MPRVDLTAREYVAPPISMPSDKLKLELQRDLFRMLLVLNGQGGAAICGGAPGTNGIVVRFGGATGGSQHQRCEEKEPNQMDRGEFHFRKKPDGPESPGRLQTRRPVSSREPCWRYSDRAERYG